MSAQQFKYRAVDKAGARVSGVIDAESQGDAYRRLVAQGLAPTHVKGGAGETQQLASPTIRFEELAQFTHELSVLLDAGMLISDGLRSIADQMKNERFRRVVISVATDIQAGATVGDALARYPRTFGIVFTETVRAAERSGNLVTVLRTLAEMLEQQAEFRRTVRRALAYPIIVTSALGLAVVFLLAFVVPRFADMFEARGVELPALTRALQALGNSLTQFWWIYLGSVILAVFLGRRAWHSPQGRKTLDRWLHRVPFIRRILIGDAVARFTRVFGLCIGSGLTLVESLELSASASGRPLLASDAKRLASAVSRGERISEALEQCAYLPNFAKRLLCAGEESSQISRMCDVIARHYDRETTHLAANMATVIEPVLIAALTGVVLIVALAIFVPMWDMAGLVG